MCKRIIELLPAYPPSPEYEENSRQKLQEAWQHLKVCDSCKALLKCCVDAEMTRRFMLKDVSSPGTYVRMMRIFRAQGVGEQLCVERLEVLAIQHTRHGRKLVT